MDNGQTAIDKLYTDKFPQTKCQGQRVAPKIVGAHISEQSKRNLKRLKCVSDQSKIILSRTTKSGSQVVAIEQSIISLLKFGADLCIISL